MATRKTAPDKDALVHEMLGRVADKWTLLVIEALGSGGEVRFTRLRERSRRTSDLKRAVR